MKKQSPHDAIYATPQEKIADFAFDESVAEVFANMIERSIPGYHTIVSSIGIIAARYAQKNSNCYDLGCSLGAVALAMQRHLDIEGCRIVAVDRSPAMTRRCRQNVESHSGKVAIDVIDADILDFTISRASLVVLNFTLQFIAPALRQQVLANIYQGMLPGGVLLLSEKVRFDDPRRQKLLVELHHDCKRANGYSNLEIEQKRQALENVMILDTIEEHHQRLHKVGFASCDQWFQGFNFISFIAQK